MHAAAGLSFYHRAITNSPHRMHRQFSPRFPPSSDPGPFVPERLLGDVQNPQSQSPSSVIDVASFRADIPRSKVGRRLFCGSVCRIFETALDTTLLNVSGLRCDAEKISCRRRTFRLRLEYNFSHRGCEKPKNSAKKKHKEREQSMGTENRSNSPSF